MIHLFFSQKNTTYKEMISQNGDVILKHVISAKAVFEKNSTWYVEIEFQKSDLLGMEITDESVIKVDLNFEKNQLYRIVYPKYKKSTDTYVVYATHVFFDSQKEVFVFDDRTVSGTWDDAIKTCNDIISNSSAKYPYQVLGHRWYDNYQNIEPEDGRQVWIKNKQVNRLVLDIPNCDETYKTQIQSYFTNNSPAQRFELRKLTEMNGYQTWGIFSLGVARWIGRKEDTDEARKEIVTTYSQVDIPTNHNYQNYWVFLQKPNQDKKWYKICRATDVNYNVYIGEGNMDYQFKAYIFPHGTNNMADCLCFGLEDAESTKSAYWVRYNLIECLFGTDDNSMINRWSEATERRYIAMFDNYNCYFGKSDYYIEYLQPNEYFISNRELTEYTQKKSMENVVTGVIPKAYNGRILPNHEIVKGKYWDKGEIHRVEVEEYSDICLISDNSSKSKSDLGAFNNEENMQTYMRYQANKTLEEELQEPQTETSVTFEDLFTSNVPNANELKLNDIVYVETENGTRNKFLINKLTYNLITELPEDIDLVLESEN